MSTPLTPRFSKGDPPSENPTPNHNPSETRATSLPQTGPTRLSSAAATLRRTVRAKMAASGRNVILYQNGGAVIALDRLRQEQRNPRGQHCHEAADQPRLGVPSELSKGAGASSRARAAASPQPERLADQASASKWTDSITGNSHSESRIASPYGRGFAPLKERQQRHVYSNRTSCRPAFFPPRRRRTTGEVTSSATLARTGVTPILIPSRDLPINAPVKHEGVQAGQHRA